jgi:hypothetical protein
LYITNETLWLVSSSRTAELLNVERLARREQKFNNSTSACYKIFSLPAKIIYVPI